MVAVFVAGAVAKTILAIFALVLLVGVAIGLFFGRR